MLKNNNVTFVLSRIDTVRNLLLFIISLLVIIIYYCLLFIIIVVVKKVIDVTVQSRSYQLFHFAAKLIASIAKNKKILMQTKLYSNVCKKIVK